LWQFSPFPKTLKEIFVESACGRRSCGYKQYRLHLVYTRHWHLKG